MFPTGTLRDDGDKRDLCDSALPLRVGERRGDSGRAGLAGAADGIPAVDDVRLDHRTRGHAQGRVVAEVALLDGAVFDRDFAIECSRESVGDPRLDLGC